MFPFFCFRCRSDSHYCWRSGRCCCLCGCRSRCRWRGRLSHFCPRGGAQSQQPRAAPGQPLRLRPRNANGLIRELPAAFRLLPCIKVGVAVPVFYHPLLQVAVGVGGWALNLKGADFGCPYHEVAACYFMTYGEGRSEQYPTSEPSDFRLIFLYPCYSLSLYLSLTIYLSSRVCRRGGASLRQTNQSSWRH